MRRFRTSALAALVATPLLVAGCSSDRHSNDDAAAREVTSVGVGDVEGTPTALTAKLGVQVQAADVSGALDQAGDLSQKVIDAVVAAGVTRADVTTANLQVSPRYGDSVSGGSSSIIGYQATQSLTVRVKDLTKASKVIGDAAAAGGDATRVTSVGFDPIDDARLQSSARAKAFADAKSQADQYAKLAGASLGEVISVSESTDQSAPTPTAYAAPRAASVPIEPGQQTVRVSVTVKWRLK
ncbi:SIMPL domain-containing protein [Tsukamurella sp. 8F]|uniref:SIMPL domain-containing protein n=1 Tax=unclassified Tsukamurella TaxID=2633480 RepID=UPI0023B8BA83|nr:MULTISPECIES: SIMPL domain-containing protein [unclassified Tsukamurella]MDF0530023.1 SIMPL domain-containing protein [Tsukamurella sp. 8J]MDF0587205.1 SIMPL domain-containing protein [Tsukamurella sp. 8F]